MTGAIPADDDLRARVVETLRRSDMLAGDRLQVDAGGGTVVLRGRANSIATLEEVIGLVGEVEGVEDVIDEVDVLGA